jgi:WhiB family redox-sensing transcriptional regulator
MPDLKNESRLWVVQAACRFANPKLFDVVSGADAAAALSFCMVCPVKEECLQDALAQEVNPDGVWGGTTQTERRKIRRYGSTGPVPEGMAAVNAAKTHCKRNHEFTPENTRWSNGHRSCIACRELRYNEGKAAQRARRAVAA